MPAAARSAPTGTQLTDGHPTKITFGDDPDISLWEEQVTPPGIQGGGPNDLTSMHNTTWRTRYPKKLLTLSNASMVCGYAGVAYDQIVAIMNTNMEITVTFSDGTTLLFWGWLDEFVPNQHTEGENPTANVVIIPSNRNDSGVETAPDYSTATIEYLALSPPR